MGARKRVAWLGGSALIASPALADWPPYIGGGYVYSQVWGDAPTSGHGLELTYGQSDPFGGLAAVLQHDWYLDDSTRLALGGQVNGPGIGLELAWSRRDDDRGTTHGIQVAPFATLMGTVYVSGRFVFAVGDGPHGDERGFAIGLKFPYLLGDLNVGFGHGRPLRGPGGRPIGVRGVGLPAPVRVALDAPTRQALGAAWLAGESVNADDDRIARSLSSERGLSGDGIKDVGSGDGRDERVEGRGREPELEVVGEACVGEVGCADLGALGAERRLPLGLDASTRPARGEHGCARGGEGGTGVAAGGGEAVLCAPCPHVGNGRHRKAILVGT